MYKMGTYLTPDFVERRISQLTSIPDGWHAATNRTLYQLDLKMCQIKALVFSFEWGKESDPQSRMASLLDSPSRILRLDISLNEMVTLAHEGLFPFRNLRELDASLNKLINFQGIEVLRHLHTLNLAHNALRHIDGLANNTSLVELNLSSNNIRDISFLPSLINLRFLNISSNNLDSLEGVSSLPKLEDLNVQRNNLRNIIPITSCLRLRVLNASENDIEGLDKVTFALAKLKSLQVLCLFGNPVDQESHYQADILRSTNITTLDNISVRPLPKVSVENSRHVDNILKLKDAARQAFDERMRGARAAMEQNVDFLQRRITALQDEYREFEYKMKGDLEVCLRYMDTLTNTEAGQLDQRSFNFQPGSESPWHRDTHRSPQTGRKTKADYSEVKDTDEVLKCAYNELAREQDRLEHV